LRVVLDTNVLVSALLVDTGAIGEIYRAVKKGSFTVLMSDEQFRELRRTLAKPALSARIRPHDAGRLVNNLKRLA
jgi:predicted nucleic acid-binding protein